MDRTFYFSSFIKETFFKVLEETSPEIVITILSQINLYCIASLKATRLTCLLKNFLFWVNGLHRTSLKSILTSAPTAAFCGHESEGRDRFQIFSWSNHI